MAKFLIDFRIHATMLALLLAFLPSLALSSECGPQLDRLNGQSNILKSDYNSTTEVISKVVFKSSENSACLKSTWSPSDESEFGAGALTYQTQEYKLDLGFFNQSTKHGAWPNCRVRDYVDCGVLYLRCPDAVKPMMSFMGHKYIFHGESTQTKEIGARIVYQPALSEKASCQVVVQPSLSSSSKEIFNEGRTDSSSREFDSGHSLKTSPVQGR